LRDGHSVALFAGTLIGATTGTSSIAMALASAAAVCAAP
jgi:hypothetical protein